MPQKSRESGIYYGRDTMLRIVSPSKWDPPEPDSEPLFRFWYRWAERHERAAALIGWGVTLGWGVLCGYAVGRWVR